jgi:hypothetical protein
MEQPPTSIKLAQVIQIVNDETVKGLKTLGQRFWILKKLILQFGGKIRKQKEEAIAQFFPKIEDSIH